MLEAVLHAALHTRGSDVSCAGLDELGRAKAVCHDWCTAARRCLSTVLSEVPLVFDLAIDGCAVGLAGLEAPQQLLSLSQLASKPPRSGLSLPPSPGPSPGELLARAYALVVGTARRRRRPAVMLLEPANTPKEQRHELARIFYDVLGVPALVICVREVLALYASGRSTGIVIDVGEADSSLVCVVDGCVVSHLVARHVSHPPTAEGCATVLAAKLHSIVCSSFASKAGLFSDWVHSILLIGRLIGPSPNLTDLAASLQGMLADCFSPPLAALKVKGGRACDLGGRTAWVGGSMWASLLPKAGVGSRLGTALDATPRLLTRHEYYEQVQEEQASGHGQADDPRG